MHQDQIAHTLAVSDGEPIRVCVEKSELTIPTSPVKERRGPETTTVPCTYFDAVIDMVDVADAGQTVHGQLHLPASEWRRLGLHKHWEKDNAEDWRCERMMEVWLSRFENATSGEYDPDEYTSPVPADSPTISIYKNTDIEIDSPKAPFHRPDLEFRAAVAESVTDYGNAHQRRTLGTVKAVERIDDLDEWPEKRDKDRPNGPIELPSKHPDIDFNEIDPLPIDDDLLTAVFVINRHAKRFNEEADNAYQSGNGAEAKVKSTRKKALYDAKTIAIHRLAKSNPDVVEIHLHELHGDVEMFCFRFPAGYSFHQPKDAVNSNLLAVVDLEMDDMEPQKIDFQPSTDINNLQLSLSEALGILHSHGIDANNHLQTKSVEGYNFGYRISTTFNIPRKPESN